MRKKCVDAKILLIWNAIVGKLRASRNWVPPPAGLAPSTIRRWMLS